MGDAPILDPWFPTVGVECPRCHFVLNEQGHLDSTPRAFPYPCEPCLVLPPREATPKGDSNGD